MSKQMPSSGDRFVRLSGDLFKRVHNPEGALDSVSGQLSADQFARIMKFLAASGVSSTILAELEHVITNSNAELGFDARPRRGDGRSENERAFLRRFPDAARIKQAW